MTVALIHIEDCGREPLLWVVICQDDSTVLILHAYVLGRTSTGARLTRKKFVAHGHVSVSAEPDARVAAALI